MDHEIEFLNMGNGTIDPVITNFSSRGNRILRIEEYAFGNVNTSLWDSNSFQYIYPEDYPAHADTSTSGLIGTNATHEDV